MWANRPLKRYLARSYCFLRYGLEGAHSEEWWPDLVLSAPAEDGRAGVIVHAGKTLAPLWPFPTDTGNPGELVVVGSGPSLKSQAVERIPIGSALLLNGAVHLLAGQCVKPFGVVVEDERFIWRHGKSLVELVGAGTDCYFSTSVIRTLAETAPEWLATQKVRHLDFLHRPYRAVRRNRAALQELPFLRWTGDRRNAISLLPAHGLMPGGSVVVTAAQLALSFSPARIGFAGIDLKNASQPRFYEKPGDTAMSRIEAAMERILAAIKLFDEEAGRRGIVVENYSPESRLGEAGIRYVPRLEA